MELKLADNPTIEIVSEKAFLDALEKTNADALETLSEKQEEYKRIFNEAYLTLLRNSTKFKSLQKSEQADEIENSKFASRTNP